MLTSHGLLSKGRLKRIKTTELYRFAEKKGIEVYCAELPLTVSASVMSMSGNCYIGIDPFQIETEAEERVHLAHEIGHCERGAFYNPYSELDIRARHELRADRWAIKNLVPFADFTEALTNGITELWELAEYFTVTEEFIIKAVEYYKLTENW